MSVTPPMTLRTRISEAALQRDRALGRLSCAAGSPPGSGRDAAGDGFSSVTWCCPVFGVAPSQPPGNIVWNSSDSKIILNWDQVKALDNESEVRGYKVSISMVLPPFPSSEHSSKSRAVPCVCEHIFPAAPTCRIPWKCPKGCSWLLDCR